MKQQKPILHGRDHAKGGPDPIPGIGGGGIDFDQPNTGGYLSIDASQDVTIESSGGDTTLHAHGATNNILLQTDDGDVVIEPYRNLVVASLPPVDPVAPGAVWADNGTLVLSGHTAGGGGGGGITSIDDSTPSSLTGLLKGNGTDVDVAVAGTDYLTPSGAAGAYQPLDSDLSAIAALATTPYGRGLLTLANTAALLAATGLGKSCRATRSTSQTITNGALAAIIFNGVRHDTDGIWSAAAPSRLTCNTAGVYVVTANVQWAINAAGQRQIRISHNGGNYIAVEAETTPTSTANTIQSTSAQILLNVGDYLELVVYHSSGANLDVELANFFSPEFAMSRVA